MSMGSGGGGFALERDGAFSSITGWFFEDEIDEEDKVVFCKGCWGAEHRSLAAC
jgi:hypothetical protein